LQELLLNFNEKLILIGNGPCEKDILIKLSKKYKTIAVDGGLRHCLKLNINPHYVIGDIDSIKNSEKDKLIKQNKLIRIKEQETTDFEKAISRIKAPIIFCFGFIGKRLDHTLAVINVISNYHKKNNIILIGKSDVIITVSDSISIDLPKKSRVSIWPLSEIKFDKSYGLKWPLNNITMRPNERIGTSNKSLKRNIKIFLHDDNNGSYLLILCKKNLKYIKNVF